MGTPKQNNPQPPPLSDRQKIWSKLVDGYPMSQRELDLLDEWSMPDDPTALFELEDRYGLDKLYEQRDALFEVVGGCQYIEGVSQPDGAALLLSTAMTRVRQYSFAVPELIKSRCGFPVYSILRSWVETVPALCELRRDPEAAVNRIIHGKIEKNQKTRWNNHQLRLLMECRAQKYPENYPAPGNHLEAFTKDVKQVFNKADHFDYGALEFAIPFRKDGALPTDAGVFVEGNYLALSAYTCWLVVDTIQHIRLLLDNNQFVFHDKECDDHSVHRPGVDGGRVMHQRTPPARKNRPPKRHRPGSKKNRSRRWRGKIAN